ncbi:MAG: adenosine kinase [Rhodobacteraceae bacterium]|nr:adenosine kinase [Paracoccaceae bacterium]
MSKSLKVVGIGNAMVDILSHVEDDFLADNGIKKGIMTLIDRDRATHLYDHIGPSMEISGGSAANTIAGLAALGIATAYVGKVKDDQLGEIFCHDLRAQGAQFDTALAPADHAAETGRCMVMVSADHERSMNTYLGVSEFLTPDDIDVAQMADTDWIYLEGYRFDGPESHAAFAKAIKACKDAGGKVSLTLSDPFCVERHRDAFRKMIKNDVDLLFCNEHEMRAMYETDDLSIALRLAAAEVETVACTTGADGAYVWQGDEEFHAHATEVQIVDVTGAGDLFAAGFLFGVVTGRDPLASGQLGCVAAGEIISHIGARPEADLTELFKKHDLL